MNALTILIDTDVLIDFLTERGKYTKTAKAIINKSQEKVLNAFLAARLRSSPWKISSFIFPEPEIA